MAVRYQITAPNGVTYEIEGPQGASNDEVIEAVLAQYPEADTPASPEMPLESPQEPSQGLEPLPAPQVPQAPSLAPQGPQRVIQQEVQTLPMQGRVEDVDPRFLTPEQESALGAAWADPNVTDEQYAEMASQFAAEHGRTYTGPRSFGNQRQEYQRYLQEGGDPLGVHYSSWNPNDVLQPENLTEDPNVGPLGAALEKGMASVNILSSIFRDWTDSELQGGVSKDTLRQQYPNASESDLEAMHDALIGELRRRELSSAEHQLDAKNVGTATRLFGELVGGATAIDILPMGRFASVGARLSAGAAYNMAYDAAIQGSDLYYGAQDEYNPDQTFMAGLMGAGIQGAAEGLVTAARAGQKIIDRRTGAVVEPTPIATPTAKKGSVQYRKDIDRIQGETVDYINTITEDWTNAPEILVEKRFSNMKGAAKDSLALYNAQTGQVRVNTEAIVREAQRLETSVEDVLNAAVFHESLGHFGLAQRFGDELETTLADFVTSGDTNIQRRVEDWLERNPEAYKGAPNRDLLAMEEILAEWSEKGPQVSTLYDTIANKVKEFGRHMGLDLQFSEREIRAILSQAHGKVISGSTSVAKGRGYRYARPPRIDDRFRTEDRRRRQRVAQENMNDTYRYMEENNIDPETMGLPRREGTDAPYLRFMQPKRRPGDVPRLDPKDLTADELFEAQNAYDVLENMTKDYEPTVMSMDDLRAEAELRGMTASDLLKRKGTNPGDIARRLMMYDIAMEKLENKLTNLYAKVQSGEATAANRAEYAKTVVRFQELAARIFGAQSEAGRALRAIQELNYTPRKVEGIKSYLEGLDAHGFEELVNDPEFFERFATVVQDQIKNTREATAEKSSYVTNALNVSRALVTSYDLSAPLRQGLFMIGRPQFWRGLPEMFKYAMSETSYRSTMNEITSRNMYPLMVEAGVPFSRAEGKLSQREEDFMTDWAQKIPVIGRGVRASERAYTGFLNKLRADVFESIVVNMERAGTDIADDPRALKALGAYIGNATGRGNLGRFNSAAPQLNSLFFSPRLIASRINLLNPYYYATLPPPVRKEAIRDLLSFGTVAVTLLGLAHMAGADVELDPRSSDFGKIKIGNTRYDALGGFTQYLTLGARLVTGQRLSGIGEEVELGNEMMQQSRYDTGLQFFRNKFAPNASFVADFLDGQNAIGEEFALDSAVKSRLVPLYVQDVLEAIEEYGPGMGLAVAAPGLFGVGVNTYTPYAIDPTAKVEAPATFKMEELEDGENDQISVKDGVVTLKPEVKEMWQARIDEYVSLWMEYEMSQPGWEELPDTEKAEVIAQVRRDAKAEAKLDMLEILGLD